jgi:hypothetical protein
MITPDRVSEHLLTAFPDVHRTDALGYAFFFVGEDRMLPFATMQLRDHEQDAVSDLDARGTFRVSVGVGSDTYRGLFGKQPSKPGPSGVVETGHDFTALDALMPHPHYAPQSWVCVVGPSEATFERLLPLFAEAYAIAARRAR